MEFCLPHHFAVFGDVHGRIALMLLISRLWEIESGQRLAGILQVGDMGAFPDHQRLDDSTARFARHDRDELGYLEFLEGVGEAPRFLDDDAAPMTLWVRGNHEDFEHLGEFEEPGPIDPFGRLLYLPDDSHVDLGPLRIAGFGGIPPSLEEPGAGRSAREEFRRAQRKAEQDPRRFTLEAASRAFRRVDDIDVLMTHAGPRCNSFAHGSLALAELATRVRPRVHLFGHHHAVVGPCSGPGAALLVGLEHLEFDRSSKDLRDGSCGLLTLEERGGAAPSFRFFSAEQDSWWPKVRRKSYRDLWPGWS
ncbi:MAG: metallophosphoesterase [Myxococcales bacterium]|nr:metallophosphoesterase [Myxococcales bacterium]